MFEQKIVRRIYLLEEFETHPNKEDFIRGIILDMRSDINWVKHHTFIRLCPNLNKFLEIELYTDKLLMAMQLVKPTDPKEANPSQ